jgi:CheY-like chemotaxis protein
MVIRVFLLDDHEVVRRGLRELLETEADIEVVGESGLAQEAIARAPALRPTWPSSTPGYPTAVASTPAAKSAPSTPPSTA